MEFKYITKFYTCFAIGAFVLAVVLTTISLLHVAFRVLWDTYDLGVMIFLLIFGVVSVIYGHLDWHEKNDKKAGEKP